MPHSPPPERTPEPRGAGLPAVLLLLAGVGIGLATGQPTIGFLAGAAAGAAVAVLMWMLDRNRG